MPATKVKKPAKIAVKNPAKKTAPKTAKPAKKVTLDDLQASMDALTKNTDRVLGRLGNKLGDMMEYTLVPNLPEKFRAFGFNFQVISHQRKIDDSDHDLHAEIDAFLENGTQAMAVEVKVTLRPEDVNDHIKRMEKIRQYADLHNDKREFYAAIAAAVIAGDTKISALRRGFFVIEPSGEDVKITKPFSDPKVW
jgi:hypothetical protein